MLVFVNRPHSPTIHQVHHVHHHTCPPYTTTVMPTQPQQQDVNSKFIMKKKGIVERELTQVRPSLSIFRQEFSHFLCFFGEGYFVAPDCGGLYSNVFECMNVKNTTIGVNKNHSEAVAIRGNNRTNNGTTTEQQRNNNKQTNKENYLHCGQLFHGLLFSG